jgi:murein DD-endopeptidase MepM/ murein hydrolase activator NlpD
VPRNQRFPHARPTRRPHARLALIGAAGAAAILLAIPLAGPTGGVLDLQGQGVPANAIALGPTAVTATAPAPATPAASPMPTPTAPSGKVLPFPPGENRDHAGPIVARAPSIATLTGYRWPVARVRLTLPYGPTPWGTRVVNGKPFHDGIDIATFCGDRVMAAHAGIVLAAGRHFDGVIGWVGDLRPYYHRLDRKQLWGSLPIMVVTDDGNGYRSMYAHFGRIVVKVGQRVKAGQLLGYEGRTGHATGCHVHYGLFSPFETAVFGIDPAVAKRMKLPRYELARINPLKVMPPKAGINAPKHPKGTDTPTRTPTPTPTPKPRPTPTP